MGVVDIRRRMLEISACLELARYFAFLNNPRVACQIVAYMHDSGCGDASKVRLCFCSEGAHDCLRACWGHTVCSLAV